MRRKPIALFALLAAVLAIGATGLAIAKQPKKVKTSTTATAAESQSVLSVDYSGKVSSPKSACVANRKVKLVHDTPHPPGFETFGSAKTGSDGSWQVLDSPIRPIPANPVTVTVKAKRVGNKLCKEGTKKLTTGTQVP